MKSTITSFLHGNGSEIVRKSIVVDFKIDLCGWWEWILTVNRGSYGVVLATVNLIRNSFLFDLNLQIDCLKNVSVLGVISSSPSCWFCCCWPLKWIIRQLNFYPSHIYRIQGREERGEEVVDLNWFSPKSYWRRLLVIKLHTWWGRRQIEDCGEVIHQVRRNISRISVTFAKEKG